jgi:PhnB protein
MSSVAPIPEHLRTVTPQLIVADGAGAIAFYRAAFDAQLLDQPFCGPQGEVIHAEIRIGDSVVMLTEEKDGPPAHPNAVMATYWRDVDSAWERALAAGAEVIFELADQFYGERGGRLRDPFAQQWMMSQRIESLTHEQVRARAGG